MKQTISAIILTKNEEKNIGRCIQSVSWCDEIIVIDDFSEDKTIKIVQSSEFRVQSKNIKSKVYQKHLDGDFAAQRNYGLEKATGNWVIFVDADEEVSKELANEIKKTTSTLSSRVRQPADVAISEIASSKTPRNDNLSGYYIKRQDYFLGKWLKHGETGNLKLIRLSKKDAGKWKGYVHEVWEVVGKIGELKNPILHYPHPAITSFLSQINLYTDILAKEWYEEGKRVHFWSIIFYPIGKFIQNYKIRLGFLDGVPGLVMAMMMSFHSFLARGKLWLLNHHE